MNARHLVIIFARSRLAGHLGAHQMTRAILAATLLSTTLLSEITLTTLPAWADPSPVCPTVLTKTNLVYGRVLALEATNPNPLNASWDRMNLLTKQRALRDAETLQTALHDLTTKVRWLVDHECFLPATMPNWRALIEQEDEQLAKLDATIWGLRKLVDRERPPADDGSVPFILPGTDKSIVLPEPTQ
jgi:hypothetical protein